MLCTARSGWRGLRAAVQRSTTAPHCDASGPCAPLRRATAQYSSATGRQSRLRSCAGVRTRSAGGRPGWATILPVDKRHHLHRHWALRSGTPTPRVHHAVVARSARCAGSRAASAASQSAHVPLRRGPQADVEFRSSARPSPPVAPRRTHGACESSLGHFRGCVVGGRGVGLLSTAAAVQPTQASALRSASGFPLGPLPTHAGPSFTSAALVCRCSSCNAALPWCEATRLLPCPLAPVPAPSARPA